MANPEFRRHLDFTLIENGKPQSSEKAPQMPFGKRVEQYMQNLPQLDRRYIREANEQLREHATPAFKNPKSEPKMLITMPVAAHQEGAYIEQALEQYKKQEHAPAHEIILFCNWPVGADKKAVSDTLQTIDRFMEANPTVPIGYFTAGLLPDTPIGAIRKYVTDTALSRLEHSTSDDDVLMVNHDADITKMNKRHLQNLHKAFTQPGKEVTAVTPRALHERGLCNEQGELLFPNIDQVTAWYDFGNAMGYSYYELGNGVSARKFMEIGGYDRTKQEGETLDILDRMHNNNALFDPGRVRVPGATVVSSSRRLIYRLYADADADYFWDGDFSSSDHYRNEDLTQVPDISAQTRDKIILKKTPMVKNISRLHLHYMDQGDSSGKALDKAERTTAVGLSLLEGSQKLRTNFKHGKNAYRIIIEAINGQE